MEYPMRYFMGFGKPVSRRNFAKSLVNDDSTLLGGKGTLIKIVGVNGQIFICKGNKT
jgi:hypothetical protein